MLLIKSKHVVIFIFLMLFIMIFISFIYLVSFSLNSLILYSQEEYKHESFMMLYEKEKKQLQTQYEELIGCMNIKPFINCMKKDADIYTTKYSKKYYRKNKFEESFYNQLNLSHSVLLSPHHLDIQTNVIIIIPISPSQIKPRIAIRSTYGKINHQSNYNFKYLFFMGIANEYPFQFLIEENEIFNDLVVFNFTNSYKHITLQLLLSYKFIVDNYPEAVYIVRANSDLYLKTDRISTILSNYHSDIIGYRLKASESDMKMYENGNIKEKVEYPCGAFYIFSKRFIQLIVNNYMNVLPVHSIEDLYYGQVIYSLNERNITWFNNYSYYIHVTMFNQFKIYKESNITAIHGVSSSGIIYLWKLYNNLI